MNESQCAAAVLMIRPRHFASNAETLASNRFQSEAGRDAGAGIGAAARAEHDALAAALAHAGVEVHVLEGRTEPALPDEAFPNNWVSFHADGTVLLYPMMAPSRRPERRVDVVESLQRRFGYRVRRVVDLSELERDRAFLEGTGSLVLDRPRRIAYACSSPRTAARALEIFGERLGYEVVSFDAFDGGGHAIYHTNVMMSVGTGFAVVCSAAIRDEAARRRVLGRLAADGRSIVDIGVSQMHAFAGNILELRGRGGPVIAMSERARAAFDQGQRRTLAAHGALVSAEVGTIETHGGGSVRCMLAEVHLPKAAA